MASQILLSVDQPRLSVAPGARTELAVTVQNLTTLLDQVALRVEGIDPSWVQVIPPNLPVFAQGSSQAQVIISPPRAPAQAVAGIYPLRVVGKAQENAGEEGQAATELEVQLVGDYRLALDSGETDGMQQTVYSLRVQNDANAPLQLRFTGHDDAEALWYKFDPFQLNVPPGGQASASLTARAKELSSTPRALPFAAGTQGEYVLQGGPRTAAPAHQVAAQFVQGRPPRLKIALRQTHAEPTRAEYEVQLTNPGPAALPVTLSAADERGALQIQIEPAQVSLAPGGAGTARLTVRPPLPTLPAVRTVTPFRVTAQPGNAGMSAESADAAFVQAGAPAQPAFPWWIVIVVGLGIIAIVLAVLAIYLLRGV